MFSLFCLIQNNMTNWYFMKLGMIQCTDVLFLSNLFMEFCIWTME